MYNAIFKAMKFRAEKGNYTTPGSIYIYNTFENF